VTGFRTSHEQALRAQRVAVLGGRAPGARIRFDDVSLVALMTQDPEETERFLERELGPLLQPTDAARRLTSTLRVYLDEGASYVAAGRRLGVHENTVGYRVRRASELLGRRVEGGGLRLHAALLLHDALHPAEP
jgi:DNA-binding PucR family transcriptional regulator